MQSDWQRSRVHYCRNIWINYRPSALQRFHVTVLSWNESDALCCLPGEQSALFICAARRKVRRRVRRWRESKTCLTPGWTQNESNSNISCIGSIDTKEKQCINISVIMVPYIISVLIHCQTDIGSIIVFTLLFALYWILLCLLSIKASCQFQVYEWRSIASFMYRQSGVGGGFCF